MIIMIFSWPDYSILVSWIHDNPCKSTISGFFPTDWEGLSVESWQEAALHRLQYYLPLGGSFSDFLWSKGPRRSMAYWNIRNIRNRTSMKVDELPFQHHQASSNIGEFPVRKSGPRLSRAKFSQCSWEVWVQSYCEILRDPQWDAWPRPLAQEVSRWKIKPSELKNGEDQMFSVRLPCWMMGFAENLRKYGRETMGKHKEMRKAMHLVLMECGSG